MYPTIFHLQTFGTCMALAFAGAYVVFVSEFKRREAEIGLVEVKGVSRGVEIAVNMLVGFVLGYKVWPVVMALVHGVDPAGVLLSWRGSFFVGGLLAIVWGGWSGLSKREEMVAVRPYQLMPYITFMVAVWGFAGAKLFDAVEHWEELRYDPVGVLLSRSGFSYYGGLIFGALTYLYIGYRHRIRLIHMADIGSPGMMLAYGIGRIGCELSGDGDWGIVNPYIKPDWVPQWAWASKYPGNAIDAGVMIPGCTSEHCHVLPVGVYPTPLYEAVLCILLFAFMWLIRRRVKQAGVMFCLFLVLNGLERYYIEILRITPKYDVLYFQLSQAQVIALLFMAGGVAGFILLNAIGMKRWILTVLLLGCAQVHGQELHYKVEEVPEWSAVFVRDHGWFGGDGIYSVPLDGKEYKQSDSVLFIFSDSMVGDIAGDSLLPGSFMVHNSVGFWNGHEMQFYWKPVFEPHTPLTEKNDYYWLGDAFVNQEQDNTLYIFGYRIRNVSEEAFGFREVGNTLIKIKGGARPPFTGYEEMDTPFYFKDKEGHIGSYGAGIYVNTKRAGAPAPDGYVYVYGVHGMKKGMKVARVKPAVFDRFDQWRFWNGKAWVRAMEDAVDVTDRVSNELSVSPLPDGRYALVFQEGGMGTTIGMRIGETPVGPFGPVIKLWDCSKDAEEKTYVMYNAKAHPGLSGPGELLISYNVNSVDFLKDLAKHPHLYRPRFIRVRFE